MRTIASMEFHSRPGPGSHSGWAGRGQGKVDVESTQTPSGEIILRFHEQGRFTADETAGRAIPFNNVYRWTFLEDRLSLHHERRGIEEAVWLFDLIHDEHSSGLISAHPHPCGKDSYHACLKHDEYGLEMEWTIIGPVKNEHLHYRYYTHRN
ncbi:DUF6314 family protein [Kushneria phosphatilytica]|uniref:DUF6314 domain-containing protein n=1 Tax=Kushneria phosphatilytica TaxID=657387 RepID=A0A5C0ZW85_9GAMM|nr:DUF6314 family protein [Kushneria phosphatilytica]QEL10742.1 hypothetical protein FY550_06150 [Kushneria phosphatilytica]